jgi:PhzF family phenazine biosynthesis protein
MSQFAFSQVDVFGSRPLSGNPLAVVHAANGLTGEQMQSLARWTGLSETTFLLPPADPAADYHVRIFTPGGELPFAGHPTLGSAHAWLQAGGQPKTAGEVVQECGVGLVRLRLRDGQWAFAAPEVRKRPVEPDTLAAVMAALGVSAGQVLRSQWLDNGPHWLALQLDSAATVLALEPDHAALRTLAKVGVVGAHPTGSDAAFEVRAFVAMVGIPEDPVTGSLNASLAQWLIAEGIAPLRYVAAQGQCVGASGRVFLQQEGGTTWVGGQCATVIHGEITLPFLAD